MSDPDHNASAAGFPCCHLGLSKKMSQKWLKCQNIELTTGILVFKFLCLFSLMFVSILSAPSSRGPGGCSNCHKSCLLKFDPRRVSRSNLCQLWLPPFVTNMSLSKAEDGEFCDRIFPSCRIGLPVGIRGPGKWIFGGMFLGHLWDFKITARIALPLHLWDKNCPLSGPAMAR